MGGRPAEGGASRGAGRAVGARGWATVLETLKTWPGPGGEAAAAGQPGDSPKTGPGMAGSPCSGTGPASREALYEERRAHPEGHFSRCRTPTCRLERP